ncbi:MAG: hypothetical protein KJ900_07420 [Proteobacteria bacterium]|jgi:hypothetical protein|nr:hypothetical protein [Desulfocapsa sp.]MBU3946542.1 hypothetical protein [Pseudomonadota bacterium]MCG2745332.1 hypothetical protein [Desulfobacteraceae bacterium]MBU3982383.1 hypothetical protein [Pseudomonadota bacterium]MBU4028404.1 hypothetical protein [Pseudomonadota bacterium]
MIPAHLIPVPDPLQVSWGWFQILLSSTFLLHLLVMNIMLGWAIIAFCNHAFRDKIPADNQLISKKLPFTIAFTVNFGVAPLLFLQILYGHFMYTSSVLMAVFWLSIVALLILAYYATYIYNLQFSKLSGLHTLVSGIIALFLLIITFFFTNNMSLMVSPGSWVHYFNHPDGMLLNFEDSTLLPRYLHSVFASVAVGGLALGLYHDWQQRRGDTTAADHIPSAMNWFSYATIANFGIGTWYYGGLPTSIRTVTGTAGAFLLCFLLAGIAAAILSLIYGLQYRVRHTAVAVLGAIICMVTVRELVRRQTLAPWFSTSDLEVIPQYSPMLLFLLLFAAGLYLVWWMIKLVLPAKKEVQS